MHPAFTTFQHCKFMSTKASKHISPPGREGLLPTPLLIAIRGAALVALGISIYLAWVSLSGGKVIGCGPESGCDKVLHSKWAYWFGVPVSVFAVLNYVFVLGASMRLGRRVPAAAQRQAWTWLLPCALLAMGAALWFVGLQLFVVHSVCPYCMTAHAAGFVTGLLLLIGAPWRHAPPQPQENERQVFVSPGAARKIAFIALAGLAVLVSGQILHSPPTSVELKQEDILAKTPVAPPPPAVTPQPPPPEAKPAPQPEPPTPVAAAGTQSPRPFPLYGGKFTIDVSDVPSIGAPTNQHVVVGLHDYTCHHCRLMHPRLVEAQRVFSNSLVIVGLPMPLDPQCNSTMTRANPNHTNACAYGRLALAVWRADRAKHHEFEDWLFTGEKPPPVEAALERARSLVGADKLSQAIADPWVEDQLKQAVAIYELAYRSGQGRMPQLIVGSSVAVGTYESADLMKLFAEKLGLIVQP